MTMTGREPLALEVCKLSKAFPFGFLHRQRRPVLRELDFQVQSGEIFGYLGPNGSGKTTTLKILMGLVFADGGSARILGTPAEDAAWRLRVGYLPEHPYFYDYLSPMEYLDYVGTTLRALDVGAEGALQEVDRARRPREVGTCPDAALLEGDDPAAGPRAGPRQ